MKLKYCIILFSFSWYFILFYEIIFLYTYFVFHQRNELTMSLGWDLGPASVDIRSSEPRFRRLGREVHIRLRTTFIYFKAFFCFNDAIKLPFTKFIVIESLSYKFLHSSFNHVADELWWAPYSRLFVMLASRRVSSSAQSLGYFKHYARFIRMSHLFISYRASWWVMGQSRSYHWTHQVPASYQH